jgi:hypothetical protein
MQCVSVLPCPFCLVQALRRTALAGTELAQAQVGTIRLKLFKVAARVTVSARRVIFHLASSYPYQELFRAVFANAVSKIPCMSRESGRDAEKSERKEPSSLGVRGTYAPKSQDPSPAANNTTKSVDPTIIRSPSNADEISGLRASGRQEEIRVCFGNSLESRQGVNSNTAMDHPVKVVQRAGKQSSGESRLD